MPHPPIMLPEIGKGEDIKVLATQNACAKIAEEIAETMPEVIVVVTPHGPMYSDALYINGDGKLNGNFSKFGASMLKFSFEDDLDIGGRFAQSLEGTPVFGLINDDASYKKYKVERTLDHGALVPLYFVTQRYKKFRLIHIAPGFYQPLELYHAGARLGTILKDSDRKAVVIASSDLSHRLSKNSQYGFHKDGPVFDKLFLENLKNNEFDKFLTMDSGLIENAGQCGYLPVSFTLGVFSAFDIKVEVLSYEGPFGIGYGTAGIKILGEKAADDVPEKVRAILKDKSSERIKSEDEYVKLARNSINHYFDTGRTMEVPDGLSSELTTRKAGSFVSLKKDGSLRGCIGTVYPVRKNLASEIIENALSAALHDPRFSPVKPDEIDALSINVDVLNEPEPINDKKLLDPKIFGVIVRSGRKSGVLLPDLEGVEGVDQQLSIVLQKAGIKQSESFDMERFTVTRHV